MIKSYLKAVVLLLLPFGICIEGVAAPCTVIASYTTPILITTPGRYCLMQDVVSNDGSSVWIQADNVTLDLAGHKITSKVVATFGSVGINAQSNQSITIMNGTVQGFNTGILLGAALPIGNPGNYVVTNMKIRDTTMLNSRAVAIYAQASNVTLSGNFVSNVSGDDAYGFFVITGYELSNTANVTGKVVIQNNQISHITATGATSPATAIYAGVTSEALISSNYVTEIKTPSQVQYAVGISVLSNANASVQPGLLDINGNYVWNSAAASNSLGIYVGSWLSHSVVHDSTIGGMTFGIRIAGAPSGTVISPVLYLYNSVFGAATPYFGGISGPNNRAF